MIRIFISIILLVVMFFSFNAHADDSEELECLSKNIYHEARNESALGQIAVAMVTMQRVRESRFPNTVCGVVTQGYKPGKRNCHFSWYCDGKPDSVYEHEAYEKAIAIAEIIYYNYDYMTHPIKGADHYHATYVNPSWNANMTKVAEIGNHIFWKWE